MPQPIGARTIVRGPDTIMLSTDPRTTGEREDRSLRGPQSRTEGLAVSVLQRFEKRLEGLVEGAFAKVFKGVVHPVEILNAMQREAEAHKAILAGGRTLVPNRYVIDLSPYDHSRLAPYAAALAQELAQSQAEFIGEQGWTVYGDVIVEIERGEGLDTGMFRVTAEVYTGGDVAPAPVGYDAGGGYSPYGPRAIPAVGRFPCRVARPVMPASSPTTAAPTHCPWGRRSSAGATRPTCGCPTSASRAVTPGSTSTGDRWSSPTSDRPTVRLLMANGSLPLP